MRPFFRYLVTTILALAAISSWSINRDRQITGQDDIPIGESPQIPAAETTVVDATPPTPTNTPTPEPDGVDIEAPQVVSIVLAKSKVNTIASSQPITVVARILDDLSGLQSAVLWFAPTSGGTQRLNVQIFDGLRTSGDRRDGIYEAFATLPKYSAHARWHLASIELIDNANNSCQWTTSEQVAPGIPACDVSLELPYFVNGEDTGPLPIPTAATIEPVPVEPPDENATREVDNAALTPWPGQLHLPAVSD